jgi:hypothetical protein
LVLALAGCSGAGDAAAGGAGGQQNCDLYPEVLKHYDCPVCGHDYGYNVVCRDGAPACDTSAYPGGDSPTLVNCDISYGCSGDRKPKGQLGLGDPLVLYTNRPTTATINVMWYNGPKGDGAVEAMRSALPNLFSLEDLSSGAAVPVTFEPAPTEDPCSGLSLFYMLPEQPYSTDGGYRLTVHANTDSDDPVVYDFGSDPLTEGTASLDFYTASRPMLSEIVHVASHGKVLGIYFSELVAWQDIRDKVSVTVDGVPLQGCVDVRGSCGHGCGDSATVCELTMSIGGTVVEAADRARVLDADLPATFTTMVVSVPAGGRGARGTFADGLSNNKYASLEGNEVVYTIPGSEFGPVAEIRAWAWRP